MISKTKVYKILSQLDSYRLNRFKKYLLSPYLNTNEELILWFDAMKSTFSLENNIIDFNKKTLWKKFDTSNEFNDVKFRKLNSDLLKQLGEFFALERYKRDDLAIQNYLSESIIEDELEDFRATVIKQGDLSLKRTQNKSSEYYLKRYFFEKNRFNLTSDFELKKGSRYQVLETNMSSADKQLDIFFIAEKLKLYCELHYLKRILNYKEAIKIDDNILSSAKSLIAEDIIPVAIYYYIFQTYENPEVHDNYIKLKEYVLHFLHYFPPFEAREIFRSTLNYCILQINRGNMNYQQEMHEMYIKGVQEEILIIHNVFPLTTFRNIILNALRLGYFDWTEHFINEYKNYLHSEVRDNAISFNLARMHWYKMDYQAVIEVLRDVEYEDLTYNLNAKVMLLTSYYELDEIEVLFSFLESYRAYISRNRSITANRKNQFLELIKFSKKMIKIMPNDKEKILKLRDEVTSSKNFTNKGWVIEKLDELAGQKLSSAR